MRMCNLISICYKISIENDLQQTISNHIYCSYWNQSQTYLGNVIHYVNTLSPDYG